MTKVLIVDDQQVYLRALRDALASSFEVMTASNLESACRCIDPAVGVALVDVRLSEADPENRDGIEFLRWSKGRFPEIPVVMMSAYRDFDAAVESQNLGAIYFAKKPIDVRHLKELLMRLVAK